MNDLANDIIDHILMRISRLSPEERRAVWREIRDYARQQIAPSVSETLPLGADGPRDSGDR